MGGVAEGPLRLATSTEGEGLRGEGTQTDIMAKVRKSEKAVKITLIYSTVHSTIERQMQKVKKKSTIFF